METSIQTYVNPLSDAGFKALLCDPANKPVLIGMLNAFLPPDRTVENLEYATTEIPGLTLAGKASRVDLRCIDTRGRSFIVEVQRSPQPNFFRRCVYYASRIYSLGARRGDGQRYDILPVYLVALLDRGFGFRRDPSEWEGRYVSRYTAAAAGRGGVPRVRGDARGGRDSRVQQGEEGQIRRRHDNRKRLLQHPRDRQEGG